jgi:hypothetical protein
LYPDFARAAWARFWSRNVGAVAAYPGMQPAFDGVDRQLADAA